MGFLGRLKAGLKKTQDSITGKIQHALKQKTVSDGFMEELEESMIRADMNVALAMDLVEDLQSSIHSQADSDDAYDQVKQRIKGLLPEEMDVDRLPKVILVLGVNGSGKTTTIAKLAQFFKSRDKSCLLVAGDTFRAAAMDQLAEWARRLDVPLVSREGGADPASVVYEGIDRFCAENYDYLIVDTAGRLHTNKNLMDELGKVKRIIQQKFEDKDVATCLILDATTGQNGLIQAREFSKHIGVDRLILAKLDSSAKGGFVFSIAQELNLPVQFIGVGEGLDDLIPFSRNEFVEALFEN